MQTYNVTFNVYTTDRGIVQEVIRVQADDMTHSYKVAKESNCYAIMINSDLVTEIHERGSEWVDTTPNCVTIKGIDCYPKVYECTNNTAVKFSNEEYDFICCDSDGKNWTETVDQLIAYANRIGQSIVELEQV